MDWLYINLRQYNADLYLNEQIETFRKYDLDYITAKRHVERTYKDNPVFTDPMSSEHQVFFAALAQKGGVRRILEIGTHNGINAAFLATLFPESAIITLDLPDNDGIFLSTYARQDSAARQNFIDSRNGHLSNHHNITFRQENSLGLTFNADEKYDLIWIDGAHGYPVVAADITNALRMLNKHGVMLCDDIFKTVRNSDAMYSSVAGHEVLSAFRSAGYIWCEYMHKRIQKPYALERFRKYIAIVRLS